MLDTGIADSSDASAITIDSSENVTIAGTLAVGTATFADNAKAIFGAGSDLQIYHDGSNSFIKDTGDGILFVQGSGSVRVLGSDTSENLARFNENSSVQLYYDNAEKLATTSTGIDVTGTATMDGLDITESTNARMYSSDAIGEVGNGNFALQVVNAAGSALKPLGFRAEDIRFATGSTERVRITDTGLDVTGDIDVSSQIFVGAQNSTFAENNLRFLSGGAAYIDHSTVGQDFIFRTSASSALDTTALTIQHDGNLMIGGTNVAPVSNNVAGISLRAVNGEAQISVNGAAALYLNRKTNDGALAYFRKDGGTIGALATAGGDLVIGSHNTCLRFDDSADDILPTDDAGVVVNNTLSLGSASARFKDLYLSGGVVFDAVAGNATSNTLDDYEEGTWTPTINAGVMSSAATGTYTKVGRLVTVTYYILLTTMGGSQVGVQVGGLPFTSGISGNTGSHSAGSILCRYFTKNQIVSYVPAGVTYIAFYNNSSSDWDQITFGEIEASHDNDFEAHGTLQYIV